MKISKIAAVFLLPALSLVTARAGVPIAEWDPSNGSNIGGGIEVPDTVGSAPLRGGPATTATIETSEDYPNGAAIVFTGEQSEAVRTPPGVSMNISRQSEVEINFLIDADAGESTILSASCLEIRYNPAQGNIECIAYLEPSEGQSDYKIIRHRFAPGRWGKLVLKLGENTFDATLNGQFKSVQLHAKPKDTPSAIILGGRILAGGVTRPLKGKVGSIGISLD